MQRELETARDAARQAGQLLMQYYGSDVEVNTKGADDPVTQADLESN